MAVSTIYIALGTILAAAVAAVVKYRRRAAHPDSRRVAVSFLDDPITQREFHIPDKCIVSNMENRCKTNKAKLKTIWDDNKMYFNKIWARLPSEKRTKFIDTLLGELWELLEPYSMVSRDMKAAVMPALPLGAISGNITEYDTTLSIALEAYFNGKIPFQGSPVCRAVSADSPLEFTGSGPAIDAAVMIEAEKFIAVMRELTFSMFLIQVLQRYTTDPNASSIGSTIKQYIVCIILGIGSTACVVSLLF